MIKIPLGNERLFLSSPSANVCFRLLLEGDIAKDKIDRALKKACLRHPLLNSFIEREAQGGASFSQRSGRLKLEYYNSSEMGWVTWFEKADRTPFDFSKGPLARICAIAGKNTELVVLGHHVLGDGAGYLNLARDILLALDGKPLSGEALPPFEDEERYFKKTELLDSDAQALARGLNDEWRQNRAEFSKDDYLEFFNEYAQRLSPKLYVRSIQGEELSRLEEKSEAADLTIGEMLAASFALAAMEFLGRDEIRLGVAADIRGDLVSEPAFCMGNFVTGIAVQAGFEKEKDFLENAAGIARKTQAALSNAKTRHLPVHFLNEFDKDLLESVPYAAYGSFGHPASQKIAQLIGEGAKDKGLGLSNLGRLSFDGYSRFAVLDAQFVCPAFPANLLTVGAMTANGRLNLCVRYNEGEIGPSDVRAIYENAAQMLCPQEIPDDMAHSIVYFGPKF